MIDNIFIQFSSLLAITVSIALVMKLFRQPLIVSYIVAGIIGGPLFLDLLDGGEHFFETFASFGIVLLLFIVGLSLNFDYIKRVGKSVFVGSISQFFATALFGFVIMKIMGFGAMSSLFIAVAITFSSTIIVVKLLTDKEEADAMYGRYVIGLLLMQDIIAIGIMIFLNTVGIDGSWKEILIITLSKGALLVGAVYLMAKYILPKIITKVAYSGEMLFIFTVAWCFGIASLVYWAGFTIEVGAIIAGISLGASPYQAQIASRIRPLRDFFIVLFFIVLGSQMQLGDVKSAILPTVILSIFVLIIDPFLLYIVMRMMKYTRRNAFLAAITAAQVSEFGFILVFKGRELGYLYGNELTILTFVALVTIVISSYLITYNEQIYIKLLPFFRKFGKDNYKNKHEAAKNYKVWVFGYHRIGWKVCEALESMKINFAVVDFNPEAVEKLKRRGITAFYGDVSDVEFLETLPLEKAKMIISTIPSVEDQKIMVNTVRESGSKAFIITNLYHASQIDEIYQAGADYVMMPHLLGGSWVSNMLKERSWSKRTFASLREDQKKEMKQRFDDSAHE